MLPVLTLRNILEGQRNDADAYKELLKNLKNFLLLSGWQGDLMQRQVWRLQDLRDGGGLGFTVELFFLALGQQLLSTSSSKESDSALYTGTFRAITSDWSKHKHSLGTQNLLFDIAMSRHREFEVHYPAYWWIFAVSRLVHRTPHAPPHPGAPSGNGPIPNFWTTPVGFALTYYTLVSFHVSPLLLSLPHCILVPMSHAQAPLDHLVQQLSSQKQTRPPFLYPHVLNPLYLSHLFSLGRPVSPCLHL